MLDTKCELVCAARTYDIVRDCVQYKLMRLIGGRIYKAKKRVGVTDGYESIEVGQAVIRFESIEAGYKDRIDYMLDG